MHLIFYCMLLLSVLSFVRNAPMKPEESKRFLMNYGYISSMKVKDSEYKRALQKFQKYFSLPMSGKLDVKTIKQMRKPRCGRPDKLSNIFTRNPWQKSVITYKFNSFPRNGLARSTAIREVYRAFGIWSKYIPVRFVLRPEGPVDIDIHFLPASKGDGIGNTLAYAYFPKIGNIYFDAEHWSSNSYRGTNLLSTAAHEIGHSLGLQHSTNGRALMNPYLLPYNPNLDLYRDDVQRIQSLYGRRSRQRATARPDLCTLNKIDTIFFSLEEQALYITEDNFAWKLKNKTLEPNFPREISKVWPGIPDNLDAAYYFKNNTYFAKDLNIWRYDGQAHDHLDLVDNLDAAGMFKNKLYLFSDSKMWSFDMSSGEQNLEPGFPKQITSVWENAPTSVDAIYYDQEDYFYLFKDSQVYKYNENQELVDTIKLKTWLKC